MNRQKIAILVDSCTDVPQKAIAQYGMYVVPLKIIYHDREYTDRVTITPEEIYADFATEIPKTSLPSGEDIIAILEQIKADGYEKVLAITISSGLSGTFNVIDLLGQQFEGLEIVTIDTKNIAIGSGLIAIAAAEYLAKDLSWEALIDIVKKSVSKSKVFFCVKTLEYLQKGGRIGLVASLLGNALNLKPVISCNDEGVYYTIAKVRGRQQSLQKTLELALDYAAQSKRFNIAVVHGNAAAEAAEIKAAILAKLPNCTILAEGQISPALVVHTGPGLVGIGIQLLDD